MPDFPSHASPALPPRTQSHDRGVADFHLEHDDATNANIPPLASPALTPSAAPFTSSQRQDRRPESIPVALRDDQPTDGDSPYLQTLPQVVCEVRARIPTTTGQEMFLHLYSNSSDNKEHLAIVFGSEIRSRSLDAVRPGETERDRMIRGAYSGTLFPGRTHSRVQQLRTDSGVPSRPSAGYLSQLNGPQPITPVEASSSDTESVDPTYPESGPPLVRIHSECYTGETVWSARCDCGEQLDEAARLMSLPPPTPAATPGGEHPPLCQKSTGGVIVYLRQEGRGIGLLSKLKAYNLQDLGHDTMEANILLRHPGDARSYGLATAILLDLGLGGERGIQLLTNNPEKIRAVEGPNQEIRVINRVPMIPLAWKSGGKEGINSVEVERYISTKIEKFKHMFSSE